MLKIYNDNKDYTREQSRYEFKKSVVDFQHPLYIGYYKPIKSLYLNIEESEDDLGLALESWDGSDWQDVKDLKDLTFGLSMSGFVSWENSGEKKKEIQGKNLYWYRLSIEQAEEITFKGISVLFSDDQDLVSVYPDIMNNLPEGQSSFVRFHDQAAKDILSDLRRLGLVVDGRTMGRERRKLLDRFDLLDIEEVRESAKYLALSSIFGWLSDAPSDKWELLEAKYRAQAGECLSPIISLDLNDNGKADPSEVLDNKVMIIGRL